MSLGAYQGALEFKESYVKEFLAQTAATIVGGSYDVNKLEAILDLLAGECAGSRRINRICPPTAGSASKTRSLVKRWMGRPKCRGLIGQDLPFRFC